MPGEKRATSLAQEEKIASGCSGRCGQPTAWQKRWGGHPTTTKIRRASGQTNTAGARLEDIITGEVCIRTTKLGTRHTAAPDETKWKIPGEQVHAELALGRSPNTIETVLLATTGVVSMSIAEHVVPRFFTSYVKGAENPWDDRKVLRGFVDAPQTMASQA